MTPQQKIRQFSRLLSYILEKRPGEFGLIPDESGYVKIRELLKALNETDGWRHIKKSNLNELLLFESNAPVEISGDLIRAKQRRDLPEILPCRDVPKILYTCVREKAYPRVREKGIFPAGHAFVISTPDMEMARRLGRRKDRNPVLLTILTAKTTEKNIAFWQFESMFYMASFIPADAFTGPPLPKKDEKEKSAKKSQKPAEPAISPGSFAVTPEMFEPSAAAKSGGKKKKINWKHDRKHRRKNNKHVWPDES